MKYLMMFTIEDVFHGRLQQKGRLDIASKILGIRLSLFIISFILSYMITHNLLVTEIVTVSGSLALAWGLNRIPRSYYEYKRISIERKRCVGLIKICFPLAVSMILIMYMANAPKYIIDTVVSDEIQTKFNIIFMPVFVISIVK